MLPQKKDVLPDICLNASAMVGRLTEVKGLGVYLTSVLNASAMVGRLTEVKGVVYCTNALLLICISHTS